ncbi:MAG: hypothetical protein SF339_06910 [Blastocatellia bacterium]|nr:hypothetical protein [Blastocatellia bacterium]
MKLIRAIFVVIVAGLIGAGELCEISAAPFQNELPPQAQALLNRARQVNPQRYQFAIDRGAKIVATGDGRSFYLAWFPQNAPANNRTMIVTLHGSGSWAFDEFFLWHEQAAKHGHGILALQWWLANDPPPNDYYPPNDVYQHLEPALKAEGLKPGRVMLHGFSRGGANLYYVRMFDRIAKNNFFALTLANAGGASTNYPFYLDVTAGKYGATPFTGARFATFCGGRDPNPDRDGCPAMRRTAEFLRQYGGAVDLTIEDPNLGHGGFHQTPAYMDRAVTAFDGLLSQANAVWSVRPDAGFRIANASIPNVGWVKNEVWLTVGGPGGLRLYRSARGDNASSPQTIPGLSSALNGAGYAPTETVPREGADGVRTLYVLGLAPPGANGAVLFRLRENDAGQFARDPQSAVFSGENQFIGVPDLYPTTDGKLRLIYVARGTARSNSRTAVSSDGGQSFAAEFDDPFNDLNVASPGPGNTNVDPAVVKLAQGGYLAAAMRLKKLYLFVSADGRVFLPANDGAPIEAASFVPGATGFFDPTLVQLPDGSVLMYATIEQPGQAESVVRATLAPSRPLSNVSSASYRDGALAPDSIVSAFGAELAATTESASTQPLPVTLGGAAVKVRDSAGTERPAALFFASPNQINYLLPAETAAGEAAITATRNGETALGSALIQPTAPGIFSANADGQGVPAALALRIRADGAQIYEPVARFDATANRFVPMPIDLGAPGDQVFLILFATGVRNRADLASVTARIGGLDSQALFAGPQGGLAGLDQLNLRLSRDLLGRGEVDVVVQVGGQPANPVRINLGPQN